MDNTVFKLFLGLIFFGSIVFGQNSNKQSSLLTNTQIQFSENSLGNQNNLDELILTINSEEEKLITLLVIADNYLNRNLYKESLKYIFQAENLAQNSNSENLKAFTYILLSSFYRGLEFQQRAAENLEKAITPLSLVKNEDERNYIDAKFQLEKGLLNFSISKEKEGILNLWKSKFKFQKNNNQEIASESLQFIYSKLANYYLTQNELDSSKFYFEQNLKLSQRLKSYPDLELRARNGMSKYYLQKKQTDSALYFVSEFSIIISKAKDARLKKEAFKNLAQIYYSTNDLNNYKKYNEKYLKLNDSLYHVDKESRVLLARQIEDSDAEKPVSDKLFWVVIALGIALTGLALTYGYHLKIKREYAQFQKIMKEIDDKENLILSEIQEINSGNAYVISEKTEQIILDKLKKFENSEKYINPKVSLQFLAKNLDTNTKYLSEIINKSKGQNFNNYINELRIHYILRKLKSEPKYQNYKVSSLAEECGFNSRNTFTLAFKNTLGMSPAKFISFIKKENFTEKA